MESLFRYGMKSKSERIREVQRYQEENQELDYVETIWQLFTLCLLILVISNVTFCAIVHISFFFSY